MSTTRAELEQRLKRLSIDLPAILRFESGGTSLDTFAGIANEILDAAEPADREYVWTQLEVLADDNEELLKIYALDNEYPPHQKVDFDH